MEQRFVQDEHGTTPKKVLILGPGGSGKSYIAARLRNLGINAFDGDAVVNLIHFADKDGNTVPYPLDADAAWFAQYEFLWREPVLRQLLQDNATLYLFGIADNAFSLMHLFDKTYYLKASHDLLWQRLVSEERKRENPMGITEEQRDVALRVAAELDHLAVEHGLEMIDATLSPEEIYRIIST